MGTEAVSASKLIEDEALKEAIIIIYGDDNIKTRGKNYTISYINITGTEKIIKTIHRY